MTITLRQNKMEDGSLYDVHVVLESWSTAEDGQILLTASCVTATEVDHAINRLIKELESARQQAHKAFERKKVGL
jgi:hypothetical protein